MLSWWLAIEVLGLASVPLAALVFARLPDHGWTLSKPLGLLLLGWLVWFPLSAIPTLPFTSGWILGTFLVFLAGNLVLLRVSAIRQAVRGLFTQRLAHVIASEVVFFIAFAAMTWERSFTPAVVDTEKFMDVAFVSAIWRAPHLPPPDPWLSGQPINYYYFGHFLVALLAKVLGTVPAVAFNLGVGLIFALTAVAVFGVAANIARVARPAARASWLPAAAGLLSVGFVLVLGNLDGARVWWEGAVKLAAQAPQVLSNPWAWWLHRDLWVQYDWWTPSRVVDPPNTINEFPAFSFVLADLHAHVLALPFATLAVGMAFNLLLADGPGLQAFGEGRLGLLALVVTSLAVGGLYAINGWDLPTYLGLLLLALAIQQWLAHGRQFNSLLLLNFVAAGALVVALSVLLYLPFYRGFTSPSQGIGLVPGTARTQIGQEFAVFGIQLFVVLSFLAMRLAPWLGSLLRRGAERSTPPGNTSALSLSSDAAIGGQALLGIGLVLVVITLLTRGFTGWTLLWGVLIVACAALVALRLVHTDGQPGNAEAHAGSRAELWVWCLAGTAVALIVVCELVFLRDIFGFGDGGQLGIDFRMNTVFKLYYQAWLLLGIACGPVLVWLLTMAWAKLGQLQVFPAASWYEASPDLTPASLAVSVQGQATYPAAKIQSGRALFARSALPNVDDESPTGPGRGPAVGREVRGALRWWNAGGIVVWMALVVVLLAAGAVYPVLAVSARTQNFALPTSLDGTGYMATDAENQGDAQAIAWLNAHVVGDPVLVEGARRDEYTHFGRISAFTGLPTLLGWGNHEVQWRINWLAQPGRGDVITQRLDAVSQIYTNPDQNAVLALLHQYSARYVYVGQAERELYPQADLKRFDTFLDVVYNSDGVTIYQVP
jgi:YYY domain-containing protein